MSYSTQPPRLAYFSPLPPQPSGISDYSRELLPHLSHRADLHLYIDDYETTTEIAWNFPVRNYRDFPWRRTPDNSDFTLYHLGNSAMHAYLYPYITRYPGVLVLHDWVLHHFLGGLAIDTGNAELYLRELAHEGGQSGMLLAWEVAAGLLPPPHFDYPLSGRSIDASLGVIVHSEYLRGLVQTASPTKPVTVVPMGIPLPPDPGPKADLRGRLRLPDKAFIFGSFGLATPYKRISTVLRSLTTLVARGIDAHYVIVGEVAANLNLAGEIKALGLGRRVHVTGYLPESDYNAYLHAVDVCVNLRYPTAGETSAAALRCLAAGKPTVVSNVDANRELPDACVLKVPIGDEEESMLTRSLDALANNPDIRDQMGEAARAYIARQHSLEQAAKGYISFLEDIKANIWQDWRAPIIAEQAAENFSQAYLQEIATHMRSLQVDGNDLSLIRPVAQAIADLGLAN